MSHFLFDGFGTSNINVRLHNIKYEQGLLNDKQIPLCSEFNDHEKVLIRHTANEAIETVKLVNKLGKHGLAYYTDMIELWFGNTHPKSIQGIAECISTMNEEFQAPDTLITFVDMRKQKKSRDVTAWEQVSKSDKDPWEEITRRYEWTTEDSDFCFSHQICNLFDQQHVGRGMRIYVGAALLNESIPMEVRVRNLIYQFVQKTLMLFTFDIKQTGTIEVLRCKNIAKNNSLLAFRHPGCWAFFLNCFNYPEDLDPFEIPPWIFDDNLRSINSNTINTGRRDALE